VDSPNQDILLKSTMPANLTGKICLVTGASRGIGRGIALQLAASGATVYITGRKMEDLQKCAEEMKARGAREVIPKQVDHSKEEEIKKLFDEIKSEQKGNLDILVNNAYAAVNFISENRGKSFWESEPAYGWDIVNNVGLRNHYICSSYAARIMVDQKSGLIVNISSGGGLRYLFNVAYGVGKAALDRMTQDTAVELKKHNVAVVGIWPGAVKTEKVAENHDLSNPTTDADRMFAQGESTEFSGKGVAYLGQDPNVIKRTGRILLTIDLAQEFNFTEDDGTLPHDIYCLKSFLSRQNHTWLAAVTPEFVKIPKTMLYLFGYKF